MTGRDERHDDACDALRKVIDQMLDEGMISKDQAEKAYSAIEDTRERMRRTSEIVVEE